VHEPSYGKVRLGSSGNSDAPSLLRHFPMASLINFVFALVLIAFLPSFNGDDLKIGFYDKTCPSAETLVQQAVAAAFANNSGVAAGLIRMHFHDCFVRGCDGSVLLDSTPGNKAEKDAPPNNPSLHGFEVMDAVKSAVEAKCPLTVSCADVLAFAARDSAALAGNITYKVPAGRRDGSVSIASETLTNLPSPLFNSSQLIASFAKKNLTAEEMVTLSGAHTIGVSHCSSFTNRLYNFSATNQVDPTLSPAYAALLQNQCPPTTNATTPITVALDLVTPAVLDNKYYAGLQLTLGLLTSDQALMTDPTLSAEVKDNAEHPNGWATKFKRAMVRMGGIEVLTGTQGEIRKNCRVVNSGTYGFVMDNGQFSRVASS